MAAKKILMLVGDYFEDYEVMVTAPAWPAHPEWLAKFLEVLGTNIQP
ncbi:MAG TPA: hypothetical protein VND64_19740 [Pirellulales bacterium]|nr:hypothetical protein [Pirellulales bacterium]